MPSSPRQGVARNRSLALDDVFNADRNSGDNDDDDGDESSRYGTTSTIHHLYRTNHRARDDMSEAGNQSVSTLGGVRSGRKTSATRKDGRSSTTGRAVVKRTSSRRVCDPSQSFSATSGLIDLLSPARVAKQSAEGDGKDGNGDEEATMATMTVTTVDDSATATTTTGGERRRRIPSRAKSSDSVLDGKSREKKGESSRRTTTSRRNFSHTGGGAKGPATKEDSTMPENGSSPKPKDEKPLRRAHRRQHSYPAEDIKDSERVGQIEGGEKESHRKKSSHQSSKSNRQHSSSRTEKDAAEPSSSGAKETRRSAPGRTTSSRVSSRTSNIDSQSSPRRTSNKETGVPTRSPNHIRQSSDTKRTSTTRHLRSASDSKQPVSSNSHRVDQKPRKPSTQQTRKSDNRHRHTSPARKGGSDEYDYGPGSPGRSPKKSVGRIQMDDHSDSSSSIDRYKAESSASESESADSKDSDLDHTSDDDDGYANPYTSKPRKGKYHDDDEDTVLQFDPTQHDGVQQVKRSGLLQYEFENADGTSVVGQITELADPVGESQMLAAQQENDKRKESLFDFLTYDDTEGGHGEALLDRDDESIGNDAGLDDNDDGSIADEEKSMPLLQFEMPSDVQFDGTKVLGSGGQLQDSWARTEDDDPLSPTQTDSPRKRGSLRKLSRKTSGDAAPVSALMDEIVDLDKKRRTKEKKKSTEAKMTEDHATVSDGRLTAPLSPSRIMAKVKSFSLGESFNLGDNDDNDEYGNGVEVGDDINDEESGYDVGNVYAKTSANIDSCPTGKPPTNEADSPKKAGRRMGKGLGGIGRYFGRSKRHDDDDDMMSVGSTSIGFFNTVKQKHKLLGDDSSIDSGAY